MRRLKSAIAGVLAVLLMAQATGCSSWKALTQPVPVAVAQHPHHKLQLVLVNGRTIEADSARASVDAVVTYHRERLDPERVDTIPLAQVEVVKVSQFNMLKTAGLVGLVVGVAMIAGAVIGANSTSTNILCCIGSPLRLER
jgi:DNA-binding transcriptional LysR family regulator